MTALVVLAASAWALFALRPLDRERSPAALSEVGPITRIPLGVPPQLIAANEHAAWTIAGPVGVGGRDDGLFRVDRATGQARQIELRGKVMGVGASGDSAWALACQTPEPSGPESCADAALVELDPQGAESGRVDVGPASSPTSIAAVGDAVAVLTADGLAVVRDGVVERHIDCCRSLLFAGGFGSVWSAREGAVDRVDPSGGGIQATIEELEPCTHFGSIAAGEGSVWITSCDGRVWKIDPSTNRVGDVIDAGSGRMLAAGDGSVWVGSRTEENDITFGRIDPRTGEVGPPTTIPGSLGLPEFVPKTFGPHPLFSAIGGGTLWFSNYTEGELVRIQLRSPDHELAALPAVSRFDVGGRPTRPIAVGFGAAWIILQDGGPGRMALARIDGTTGAIVRVTAAGEAGYVAVGDGSVWTATCANPDAERCSRALILRIDPATLEVTAEIPIEGSIFGITYGAGSLWLMERDYIDGFLIRIDPGSNRVVAKIGDWACCSGLAVGEGAVWGLGSVGRSNGELTSLDPVTEEVTALPRLHPRFRFGGQKLTVGEGAVWVIVGTGSGFYGSHHAIARIDPATGKVTDVAPDIGFGWFAAGEGAVWFARPVAGVRCVELIRLDPSDARSEVVRVVPMGRARYIDTGIGGPAVGVGVGEGAAWITIDQSYEVIRIDLASLGTEPVRDPGCTASPSN
ncbi:MAG: hypothetical protein WD770_10725 [Actinomycetota bacterium]